MRNTITSKNGGFTVKHRTHKITGEKFTFVLDGDKPLFQAELVDMKFYKEEEEGNECFMFCEVFTTVKGNQFIYFRDNEIDVDYIVKVNK